MHHFILKLNSSTSYDFIHVGKCGGSSLGAILSKNNIKFKSIHAPKLKPQYHPNKIYIVAYRDPIKRLFSILNWFYPYQNWGILADKAFSFDFIMKGSQMLIEEFPTNDDIIDTKEKIEKI